MRLIKRELTLTVEISEIFEYVINQLNADFASYELREFINLKSSYSKNVSFIKQWRTVDKKIFLIQEFYLLLDIPKKYSKGLLTSK